MAAVDLSVELLGLELKSPIVAASGPPTKDADAVARLAQAGVGAVITKTILLEPSVNPRPCMYRGHRFFLNTERCSTLSLSQWLKEELPRMAELPVPVIASIGMTPEDAAELAPMVVDAGADMVELAIFTPYDDPSPMARAVELVRERVSVPVLAKLSCNVHDLVEFGLAIRDAGAHGFSAIDALKAGLAVDWRSGRPVMSRQGFGRISGEAIKPLALYHVAQLTHYVGLPVIGTGGVFSAQDVLDMVQCGATAVGICTALILSGPTLIPRLLGDLRKLMEALGIARLEDIRSRTLEFIEFPDDVEERREYEKRAVTPEPIVAHIDGVRCVACGRCREVCPYGAVMARGEIYRVDREVCEGCGLCVSVCPKGAIELIETG
ncbi:4Fe-4S binding protein [Candidatus Bipolaricaulota sp. J31]